MNKELESKALEIITQIQDAVKSGLGNVPAIAHEYLVYSQISAWIFTVLSLLICILMIKLAFFAADEPEETGFISCSAIAIAAFAYFVWNVQKIICIMVAPNVFLLKEISNIF